MAIDMNHPTGQRLKGEFDAAAAAYQVAVSALSDAVNRGETDVTTMDAITRDLDNADTVMNELNARMSG